MVLDNDCAKMLFLIYLYHLGILATDLFLVYVIVGTNKNRRYALDMLADVLMMLTSMWAASSILADPVTTRIVTVRGRPWLLNLSMSAEYVFYLGFTAVNVYDRDLSKIPHHICTMATILLADLFGHAHASTAITAVFHMSTPFLTAAKYARYLGYEPLQTATFTMFGLVFFLCRIGGVPAVMAKIAWELPRPIPMWPYGPIGALLGYLYILQWVWFTKIVRILHTHYSTRNARKKVQHA